MKKIIQARSWYAGKIIPLLLGVLLGIGGYAFLLSLQKPSVLSSSNNNEFREIVHNYQYVDPLLACDTGSNIMTRHLEFENQLRSFINDEISKGHAKNISIYFRQLDTGQWVGIDENHKYDPASLLKIVLMITYFKEINTQPDILDQHYTYTEALERVSKSISYTATTSLEVGRSYTANKLIHAMIVDSDNGATYTLLDHVDQQQLALVYKELGIPDPNAVSGNYKITARQYSLFFRILYNATYLDEGVSEKAMELLVQTSYRDGLVSGVPDGISVAHKYGEHVNGAPDGSVFSIELHDCGIVYKLNSPYFLCVMTSGKSIDDLTNVIQQISKMTYAADSFK